MTARDMEKLAYRIAACTSYLLGMATAKAIFDIDITVALLLAMSVINLVPLAVWWLCGLPDEATPKDST